MVGSRLVLMLLAVAGCAGVLDLDKYENEGAATASSGGDGAAGGGGSGAGGSVGGTGGMGGSGGAPSPSWCDDGTVVFTDEFDRAVTDGWGTPSPGALQGPPLYYFLRGSPNNAFFSVDDVAGTGRIRAVQGNVSATVDVGAHEFLEIEAEIGLSAAPAIVGFRPLASLSLRDDHEGSFYEARLTAVSGEIKLQLNEVATTADVRASATIDTTAAAGQRYHLRFRVEGFGPVDLKASAWRVGETEPTQWTIEATAKEPKTATSAGAHGGASDPPTGNIVYALFDKLQICQPAQ